MSIPSEFQSNPNTHVDDDAKMNNRYSNIGTIDNMVQQSGTIDEWFVPQPSSMKDVWLDKNEKDEQPFNSDSSSAYSLSPSDKYQSLFDSEILVGDNDVLDSYTTFTTSNTVSTDNSPYIKPESDNGFDLIKSEFAQLPLAVDLPALTPTTVLAGQGQSQTQDKKIPRSRKNASSTRIASSETTPTSSSASTSQKNQRKKRGPRKRLTADQRETHNMIEKRYRININTKIGKLQKIIPWVACEDTAFEVDTILKNSDGDSVATPISSLKLNKSMILEKAVDYILYLQNNERLFEMEVQRLKKEVEHLKSTSEDSQ